MKQPCFFQNHSLWLLQGIKRSNQFLKLLRPQKPEGMIFRKQSRSINFYFEEEKLDKFDKLTPQDV